MIRPGPCSSWRPRPAGHSPTCRPGRCHRCWEPCHRPATPGEARCETCTSALEAHPDTRVRMALACERYAPKHLLERLANDEDLSVALVARHRLSDPRSLSGVLDPPPGHTDRFGALADPAHVGAGGDWDSWGAP